MKMLCVALCLLTSVSYGGMILPIIEVYDGDTIKTQITLPPPLDEISIRIDGIDTPELPAKSYATTGKLGRSSCVQEAELALLARARLKYLVHGTNIMTVTNFEYGKYSGRIVGDVEINGVDVATMMIDEGFAVPYHGGTKTKDWCK